MKQNKTIYCPIKIMLLCIMMMACSNNDVDMSQIDGGWSGIYLAATVTDCKGNDLLDENIKGNFAGDTIKAIYNGVTYKVIPKEYLTEVKYGIKFFYYPIQYDHFELYCSRKKVGKVIFGNFSPNGNYEKKQEVELLWPDGSKDTMGFKYDKEAKKNVFYQNGKMVENMYSFSFVK